MDKDLLLNKYIDGNLLVDELKTFNTLAETDLEFRQQIKLFRFIDKELSEYKPDEPSFNFTSKVMNKILVKYSKAADNVFFLIILVFMGLIVTTTVAAFFAGPGSTDLGNTISSKIANIAGKIKIDSISLYLKNNNVLLILSLFSLLFLTGTYFIQQNFHNFKRMLDKNI